MHAAWRFWESCEFWSRWSVLVSSHGFFGAVCDAKTFQDPKNERIRKSQCNHLRHVVVAVYRLARTFYSYPIQPRAVPRSRSFQIILCRVASAFDPPSVPMVVVDDLGTPGWVPELHMIIDTCISYCIYMLYNTYSYIMSIIIYVWIYIYMCDLHLIYIYIHTCNIWYIYDILYMQYIYI